MPKDLKIVSGKQICLFCGQEKEMLYDENGAARETNLADYHIFRADEMPDMEALFVETFEPTHPFGVKAVAEIPLDGVAPAVGNAILDACGANVDQNPATPERIWKAIRQIPRA